MAQLKVEIFSTPRASHPGGSLFRLKTDRKKTHDVNHFLRLLRQLTALIPNRNKRGARRRVTQNKSPAKRANGSQFPMPLTASFQIDKVVRFKASGALNAVSIPAASLLNLLGVATTAIQFYRLPVTAKIRKVEAWAPPDSTGASVVLSIEDVAAGLGFANPSRRKEDVTMGQNRPAHVVWKPSPDSLASKWLDLNAGQTFVITGPAGTTLDLHLSWVLTDGEAPVLGPAVVGATVGQLYMRALDSSGAGLLVPVSFTTI